MVALVLKASHCRLWAIHEKHRPKPINIRWVIFSEEAVIRPVLKPNNVIMDQAQAALQILLTISLLR